MVALFLVKSPPVMNYLQHEQKCFIGGTAERFIYDKDRTSCILNGFKNDPFYTHLIKLFTKKKFKIGIVLAEKIQNELLMNFWMLF